MVWKNPLTTLGNKIISNRQIHFCSSSRLSNVIAEENCEKEKSIPDT